MGSFREFLKKYLPASSRTLNARLDFIEEKLDEICAARSVGWDPKQLGALQLYYSCWANNIHSVHKETFGPFRGCNEGKEVVILATGPSLKYFEPIDSAVYIGLNHAYKVPNVKLDYLFMQDFQKGHNFAIEDYDLFPDVTFVGSHCCVPNKNVTAEAPASLFELEKVRKYYVNHVLGPAGNTPLQVDLEFFPVMDCWSVVFSALEFAFYTRPSKIYLVGCDVSSELGGHFDDATAAKPLKIPESNFEHIYRGYLQVKDFASSHYPDIEIVSINPIRLKGIFGDQYTESFLRDHPQGERVISTRHNRV